jgi:hypothetical protein
LGSLCSLPGTQSTDEFALADPAPTISAATGKLSSGNIPIAHTKSNLVILNFVENRFMTYYLNEIIMVFERRSINNLRQVLKISLGYGCRPITKLEYISSN